MRSKVGKRVILAFRNFAKNDTQQFSQARIAFGIRLLQTLRAALPRTKRPLCGLNLSLRIPKRQAATAALQSFGYWLKSPS